MNQSDLIDAVEAKTNLTKTDVKAVLHAQSEVIKTQLGAGNNVVMSDLGTFKVSHRKGRTGRNPRTGEPLQIAASKAPNFSASKALKEATNTPD